MGRRPSSILQGSKQWSVGYASVSVKHQQEVHLPGQKLQGGHLQILLNDDKLYNPENVRKAWDTFFAQFVTGQNALLYQMNTGHCEATRRKYYLKHATDNEIESSLDEQLKIIDDSESCYVAEDVSPHPPPFEQQDNPEPQESGEENMDTGNIGDSQEENIDGGALTPDNEDANNNSLVVDEDDICEGKVASPVPSDQEDEDLKPDSVVKVKWESERQLKLEKTMRPNGTP